jgi:SAM-dependent methyltransferase
MSSRKRNSGIWTGNEAQAWDLVVPQTQTTREADFLAWAFNRFANRSVNEVLDLGCGTGRLAVELSLRGYSVTGIDKFPAMLKRAQQNANDRGVTIDLRKTSLERLDIVGKFDAAFSVYSVFNYILDEKRLRNTLGRIRALIRPGGLLIIDMANYASIFDSCRKVITKEREGKGWSVKMRMEHQVDDVNMIWYSYETNRIKQDSRTKTWREIHVFRMWMYPELRAHLLANGFARVRLFGQLKAGTREATTHAPRIVTVCNRI